MAAQIWDSQEQRYRSIDLAQYGEDGQLAGAYAWIDGAWVTLWEKSSGAPVPLFTDDFTSPELHERWTLFDGVYEPPGLSGVVLGPVPGADFELTITLSPDSRQGFAVGVANPMTGTGAWFAGAPASGFYFGDLGGEFSQISVLAGYPWSTISVRRQSGVYSLYTDGSPARGVDFVNSIEDVLAEFIDPYPSEPLPLVIGGGALFGESNSITSVSYYGELAEVPDGPVGWDWEERFTSPSVPSGWQMLAPSMGSYDPPGFYGYWVGPELAEDFEIEIDVPDPYPAFWVGVYDASYLGTGDPAAGIGPKMQYGSAGSGVKLYAQLGPDYWDSDTHASTYMLRKQGDVYTVLTDGEPVSRSDASGILQRTLPGWTGTNILVAAWDPATGQPTNHIEAVRYRAI